MAAAYNIVPPQGPNEIGDLATGWGFNKSHAIGFLLRNPF